MFAKCLPTDYTEKKIPVATTRIPIVAAGIFFIRLNNYKWFEM